ncbi:ABC transporter substrate-binding protein [Pseudorhodoplanes sp.]|uniref:ABC transporter substrate-binding protein n=1 Tax=Pseudorhodoplanes sp. TaxID=1934341 RepID=UPI003D0B8B14
MNSITRRQFALLAAAAAAASGTSSVTFAQGSRSITSAENLPKNLDPHQLLDPPMVKYATNVYDTLYRYVDNPPKQIPWLALSHTVSPDNREWEFTLREGVRFHDGSALTAEDVVYSFQRVLGVGLGPSSAFRAILKSNNITAKAPNIVAFKLDAASGPFLSALALVPIVNKRVIAPHEKDKDWGATWLASNEAGSGAFRLNPATYVPVNRIDIERNPDHFYGWSDNPSPVDKVFFRPTREASTRVLALLNGEIDWTDSNLTAEQVERIAASERARIEEHVALRTFLIRMNNSKAPFNNLNARLCFAHAFNYDGFIKEVLKGGAQRNPIPMPKNLWGAATDVAGYEYDLDKSKSYFRKAVAEGAPMRRTIEIHTQSEHEQHSIAAEMLQADLSTVGVNLKIVPNIWTNISTMAGKAETSPDMWIHWVSATFVDPENWLGQMYDSRFWGTWKASSWYKNPKVDDLLQQARSLVKQEERAPIYEQANREIVADSVDIWIYNQIEKRGVSKRVGGYRYTPVNGGADLRWIRIT